MTLDIATREHQRLIEIAREYRQRGYDVLLEPPCAQLPHFLAPFQVDMLARRADEHVIVEVRTLESLADVPKLEALARAVQDQPSWRFELVVTNPRERASISTSDATLLQQPDITYRLREARQLAIQKHGLAAFLLAWSTTEALLRMIADEEKIPLVTDNAQHLAKSLFIYGILDKKQYDLLQDGLHAYAIAVHGYKEQLESVRMLDQVLYVAEQLARR